ncbi:MAG: hypothetical protein N2C12_09115, partial [Planctomycetales bacterium]
QQLDSLAGFPTAMFWGMRDWCFRPECLEKLLGYFPDAEVVRMHDAGHYVVEEEHARILQELGGFFGRFPVVAPAPAGGVTGEIEGE